MRIESVVSRPLPHPNSEQVYKSVHTHNATMRYSWQTVRPEPVIDGYGLVCFVCVEWCARTRCVSLQETFPLFPMCTFREYSVHTADATFLSGDKY